MQKLKKIVYTLLFFNILLADVLGVNINNSFNTYNEIYQQGVYDTYNEINSLLTQNLTNTPLTALNNKIVVALNINNTPINKILYLSVVGKKNFFNTFIAKNENNDVNYLIFGVYERKPDADYALNILKRKNIPVVEIFNGRWYNNNIILKNIVFKLKMGALKNLPVKVIVDKEVILQTGNKKNNNSRIVNNNKEDKNISKIKKLITLITHLKFYGIPVIKNRNLYIKFKNRYYGLNDQISGFTITQAYVEKKPPYTEYIFRFNDYNRYHLIYRILKEKSNCSNKNKHIQNKNNNTVKNKSIQNKKTSIQTSVSSVKTFTCNFGKIMSFMQKTADGQFKILTTAATPLANSNNVQCFSDFKIHKILFDGEKISCYKIKPLNYPYTIYINPKVFKNECHSNY